MCFVRRATMRMPWIITRCIFQSEIRCSSNRNLEIVVRRRISRLSQTPRRNHVRASPTRPSRNSTQKTTAFLLRRVNRNLTTIRSWRKQSVCVRRKKPADAMQNLPTVKTDFVCWSLKTSSVKNKQRLIVSSENLNKKKPKKQSNRRNLRN